MASVVLVDHDGAVYPHGELVHEVLLRPVREGASRLEAHDVPRLVPAEHLFPSVPFVLLEHHLGQDKDAVAQQVIVVITNIANHHFTLHALQDIEALQFVVDVGGIVRIFFNQDAHGLCV